jgi:hypothetical protein
MKSKLLKLAADWRGQATIIEVKYGRKALVGSINVITALEQCAAELEAMANAKPEVETVNPS